MKAPPLLFALLLAAPALAEDVDLEVVHRIKQEAFLNSKVMDYMHLIADENGPRMSGSPGYRRAAEAAVAAFKAAGIDKAEISVDGGKTFRSLVGTPRPIRITTRCGSIRTTRTC